MAKHYREDDWRRPIQKMEVGDKLITKSRIITRTEVELYAVLGGDFAPQFLSEKEAKEYGWERQLVPGMLTVTIGYGLLIQAGFLGDVIAYVGTKDMKFLAPVYWDDSIRMEVEVASKEKTDKGWQCEYDWVIRNQHGVAVSKGRNT